MNISVIIPAFNEEKEIGKVLGKLRSFFSTAGGGYEMIVVNDASTDATRDAVLKEPDVLLIDNTVNLGYGASIKRGLERARYEKIMIIDADNTYPVQEIPELLRFAGGNDMVVGMRRSIRYPKFNWIKQRGRQFFDFLCSYLTGHVIPDINSGLRVFDREKALRHSDELCDRFSFTTSLTLVMFFNRFKVYYTGINYCLEPTDRKSKVRMYRDGLTTFFIILRLGFRYVPLKASLLCVAPAAALIAVLFIAR